MVNYKGKGDSGKGYDGKGYKGKGGTGKGKGYWYKGKGNSMGMSYKYKGMWSSMGMMGKMSMRRRAIEVSSPNHVRSACMCSMSCANHPLGLPLGGSSCRQTPSLRLVVLQFATARVVFSKSFTKLHILDHGFLSCNRQEMFRFAISATYLLDTNKEKELVVKSLFAFCPFAWR